MSHPYVQKQVFGAGASVCSDFAAGTFSAVLGATVASTCANCVAKKYSAANASTVYTDCPAGKISAQMAPRDEIKNIGGGLCDRVCLVLVCRGRYGCGGVVLLFILGSNLGGVGPVRGLQAERKKVEEPETQRLGFGKSTGVFSHKRARWTRIGGTKQARLELEGAQETSSAGKGAKP